MVGMRTSKKKIMNKYCLLVVLLAGVIFCLSDNVVQGAEQRLPKKAKQTVLGKYVTAAGAYEMWLKAPEAVGLLDVRSPSEYVFVGHAPMAVNIPIYFYKWDMTLGDMTEVENVNFESQVAKRFGKNQTLLVMCRSGSRGAKAVNRLADLGFLNVYNITDGFEGDKIKDRRSVYKGKRVRNGWKNTFLNWTYELNPELAFKN
jgi:rhodanese-related sulfurtransferase